MQLRADANKISGDANAASREANVASEVEKIGRFQKLSKFSGITHYSFLGGPN